MENPENKFSRLDDPFYVLLSDEHTDDEKAELERRVADYDVKAEAEAKIERVNASRPACPRCSGRGVMNEYSHVMNGKCFLCGGSGYGD